MPVPALQSCEKPLLTRWNHVRIVDLLTALGKSFQASKN